MAGCSAAAPARAASRTCCPTPMPTSCSPSMGEEFGLVVCLLVLGVFAFIVLRGLLRLLAEQDLFVVLAAAGLVTSFGLQAFVNMASRCT